MTLGKKPMSLRVYTQIAPSYWAPYLINGDDSGLTEDEKKQADAFVDRVGRGTPVSCEAFGWSRFLRCDCQIYTFLA